MPSLRSSGVCSREGDWSRKGEKGDGGDGARSSHRLLCGREAFGELGLGSGGYVHLEAWLQKEELGMSGNQVLQAALLFQTCRWERNTYYTKYSEHCSAEVTWGIPAAGCIGRVSSDGGHGHYHRYSPPSAASWDAAAQIWGRE